MITGHDGDGGDDDNDDDADDAHADADDAHVTQRLHARVVAFGL